VLQCVAVCCSVLQCIAAFDVCSAPQVLDLLTHYLDRHVCWSVLQCVAVCRSVLQCVAALDLCSAPQVLDVLTHYLDPATGSFVDFSQGTDHPAMGWLRLVGS